MTIKRSNSLRWFLLSAVISLALAESKSQLYINEFCASNNTIIADEHNNFNDWIEIYNSTDAAVDIGGLFITDSLDDPTKYRIPQTNPELTTIPANGYTILWADGQEEQGVLHLSFKLAKDSGQIGLSAYSDTSYIDSLSYSKQYTNSSLSRYPDGNGSWVYPPPTPGSSNILPVISGLYINEFCTSNSTIITDEFGNHDDWIEIYNSTDAAVDIGGLFITDSLDDPTKHRIPTIYPALTTVPANGYIILWADNQKEQGLLHLDFKIGREGEQIGLAGYDGTSYIDSLTYNEQYSNSSSSRYPDGNEAWVYPPPTPGSTNILPVISGLYINEFCTSNSTIITDEFGNYDDWIEIFNANDQPVDIGGLFITDSLDDPFRYRIPTIYPALTTIPAHGHVVLWADNEEEQGLLHIDFKLGRDGEQIGLAGYDGISYIDSLTYSEQYANSSAGRYHDGENNWICAPSTPGNTNTLPVITGLFINEFSASNESINADEHGDYEDWIEIYNFTGKPVDIGGLFITDSIGNPAKHRIPSTHPDSTTIPAYGYLVLWADNQEEQGVLHIDFKLARDGEQIGLAGYDAMYYIDSLTYGKQYRNSSVSRFPDAANQWTSGLSTPGSENMLYQTDGLNINEIIPNNDNVIADEHGEFDDCIEIFNSTDKPLNIGGLFITDSLGDPAKHRIPTTYPDSTTIPPYGYLLLWADNQEEQGILHLDFKLSKTGEAIGLSVQQADSFIFIDSVSFDIRISSNKSYGQVPDGTGEWTILDIPTPGQANIISSIKDDYPMEYRLHQNTPNPFKQETIIEYYLAENVKNALISVYNINGMQIKNIPLHSTGYSSVTFTSNELRAGVYIYTLIADGQVIEIKRMIITD